MEMTPPRSRGRVRVSTYSDAMEEEDNFDDNDIALAFSGGGIRSAALCSGVLRRILQKKIKINYISCISGGNFTAAAYLDWKFRHGNEDDPKWHQQFFDHMRRRAGYICQWRNCCRGTLDTIALLLLMVLVNLFIPFIVWGGMAIPVAYLVDFVFGDIMRAGFDCSNITIPQTRMFADRNITKCGNTYNLDDPGNKKQVMVLVALAVLFLVLYVIKAVIKSTTRVCGFLQLVAGVMLGFVFIPWFMQQFTDIIPSWMNVLILGLSMFFWCGFPPLRDYAALALIFYLYGYIIKWRVYRSGFTFEYQEYYFYTALLAAGVVLWASPYMGALNRSGVYNFVKWRLQYAFFTPQSVGRCGCGGITCSDLFPVLSTVCECCGKNQRSRALTLADFVDTKPEYISNIVADYWRRDPKSVPEAMIGLCSKKIEIITEQPGDDKLNCKMKPRHIKLADAMSTAAMITKPPSELDEKYEPFRELQLILGLSGTSSVNTAPDDDFGCNCEWFKILPILLQSFAGAPLIFLAVVWLADLGFQPKVIEMLVMIVFLCYLFIFAIVAMLPTGGKKPWCAETIVRWCHVHLYHVRFLREILKVNNIGPLPPAIMSLSDLGRVEKYGLLPLLKRRMKKIVIVDGSFLKTNAEYAKYLLRSLQMAREMFNCEFTGYDGRDIIGELYKSYLTHPSGKLPRSYRFIVKYYDKTNGGYVEASQGEILILSPRHPEEGFDFPAGKDSTWGEYTRDTNIKLDPKDWGSGPVLTSEDTDRLTFCCCECCHCNAAPCRFISSKLCFAFPRHSTVNQFFTPSHFSAYHREGYRACIEADVEDFLSLSGIKNV